MAHAIWEIFLTVILEDDTTRYAIVAGLYSLMNHPGSKLYALHSQCKTLQALARAFMLYKYPQLKKAFDSMYEKFVNKLQILMGSGFCAEVVAFRRLAEAIAHSRGSKGAEIDISTHENLRNLSHLLKTTA